VRWKEEVEASLVRQSQRRQWQGSEGASEKTEENSRHLLARVLQGVLDAGHLRDEDLPPPRQVRR
jgi:hypothetical protein